MKRLRDRLRVYLAVFVPALVIFSSPAGAQDRMGSPGVQGHEDVALVSVELDTLTLLDGEKGDIEVLQLLRVVNTGDRPFLGEPPGPVSADGERTQRPVLRLPVPEGATDIAPSDSANPYGIDRTQAGIATTVPLAAGETLISYIYRVRPGRAGWALRRQIDYPTRSLNLLIGPGLHLQFAAGFEMAERKKLGSVEYKRFRGGPFSPGSVLSADIGFGDEARSEFWQVIGSLVAVAAFSLGAAWVFRRRRPDMGKPHASAGQEPPVDREELVMQIALLDEEFDAGSISQPAYERQRRRLKGRLEMLSEAQKT